jgi:hypothetical protein
MERIPSRYPNSESCCLPETTRWQPGYAPQGKSYNRGVDEHGPKGHVGRKESSQSRLSATRETRSSEAPENMHRQSSTLSLLGELRGSCFLAEDRILLNDYVFQRR